MSFVYDELDLTRDQIRLIQLNHDGPLNLNYIVETFDRLDCPSYEAVSYEWGSANDLQEILLHGQISRVTSNLHSFLTHYASSNTAVYTKDENSLTQVDRSKWLWVDQICINQSSSCEKNHQVRRMASIFEQADNVIVWLAPASSTSSSAMEALARVHRYVPFVSSDEEDRRSREGAPALTNGTPTNSTPSNGCISILCGCLDEFRDHVCLLAEDQLQDTREMFRRSYWERLWTVQEFLLAKDLTLLCGHRGVKWHIIEKIYRWHERAGHAVEFENNSEGRAFLLTFYPASDRIAVRNRRCSCPWGTVSDEHVCYDPKLHLRIALFRFGGLKCANPLDRVYGLLGLVPKEQLLDVDYSKLPSDVFFEAISVLSTGEYESVQIELYWPFLREIGMKMGLSDHDLASCESLMMANDK